MDQLKITINGIEITAAPGATILEAARNNGIHIPTLCHFEGLAPRANCRMCVVEVEGFRTFQPACATKISNGMVIHTDTEAVRNARKTVLELILADHAVDCHHCLRLGNSKCDDLDPLFCEMCFWCDCPRDGFCELQTLAREYHVDVLPYAIRADRYTEDNSLGSIIRNPNKCIKCRRCVDVCGEIQSVYNLSAMNRGFETAIVPFLNKPMADSICVHCGRCAACCPTGAIYMKEHKDELLFYTHRYGTTAIAQLDENVIPVLEENYHLAPGTISMQQVVTALKKIGIDYVVTNTVAKGLVNARIRDYIRKTDEETVIVSDSPAVKHFAEQFYPELMDKIAFFDSPQKAFGTYAKSVYAKELGVDPAQLKTIHVTNSNEDCADAVESGSVDYALNGRELYRIFLRTGGAPHRKGETLPDAFGNGTPEESFCLPEDQNLTEAETLGETRALLEAYKAGKAPAGVLWLRA